jgi:hydroxypyruvate isomerase
MPRFSANLSFLFTELPLERRFDAAAAAGFRAVEISLPEALPYGPDTFAGWVRNAGLDSVLLRDQGSRKERGELGLAGLPGRELEFRDSLVRALDYAAASATPLLHVLACRIPPGVDRYLCEQTYLSNLMLAAESAMNVGVSVCIEPFSRSHCHDYLLNSTGQAIDMLETLGRSDVYLIWDAFQAQQEEGYLSSTLETALPWIAHIQFGNPPGRHEPGRGEIDFDFLFKFIDDMNYGGWVGAEYIPSTDTWSSLRWGEPFGVSHHRSTDREVVRTIPRLGPLT